MKKNINKEKSVRVTDGTQNETVAIQESSHNNVTKFKKPLFFGLMLIVFIGCMYLIFKPSKEIKNIATIGLNEDVPEATSTGMPNNKSKAYEEEMLEQKNQDKRRALTSLSDYWNDDEDTTKGPALSDAEESQSTSGSSKQNNPALNSYRNVQSTLGSFYEEDKSETQKLRQQLVELKEQLSQKDIPAKVTVDDQLALMEKSYQMAAKYLPSSTNKEGVATEKSTPSKSSLSPQKEQFVAFTSVRKNTVSALYRESNDSTFLADWGQNKNNRFYDTSTLEQAVLPKNSIKACIQETQTIVGETGVRLRLLEPAQTANHNIPKGTILTANAKFEGGRLQLKVSSLELDENIIAVDIMIYDLDGQQGLYVPYSSEMNAITEMAGNMSQQSGTSLMLNQSAGQQVAADLSRGVVQGISGYFAKKVRTPKVTVKAGHQLFLVSKK